LQKSVHIHTFCLLDDKKWVFLFLLKHSLYATSLFYEHMYGTTVTC